jgi:hypothetical protein
MISVIKSMTKDGQTVHDHSTGQAREKCVAGGLFHAAFTYRPLPRGPIKIIYWNLNICRQMTGG